MHHVSPIAVNKPVDPLTRQQQLALVSNRCQLPARTCVVIFRSRCETRVRASRLVSSPAKSPTPSRVSRSSWSSSDSVDRSCENSNAIAFAELVPHSWGDSGGSAGRASGGIGHPCYRKASRSARRHSARCGDRPDARGAAARRRHHGRDFEGPRSPRDRPSSRGRGAHHQRSP
jgi:hypothetical protein